PRGGPWAAVIRNDSEFAKNYAKQDLEHYKLIVAGMALIVPRWEWADATVQGLAWGLVSGFTFAVLTLVNRFLVRRLDSFALAFYLDGSALIVLSPLAFYTWQMPGSGVLILMVLQGVVFTALAHTLFIWGLRTVKVQVAAIIGSLEPIYGIVLAALLLGEIPTWRIFAGGVLILAAVIWISLAKAQPPPKPGTGTVADPQG
ncbi:MAG: DMT family transporter, partial [SAR324 cluster bacterium]|nr:DMT family transporter [SAR324 cluster bacterium]